MYGNNVVCWVCRAARCTTGGAEHRIYPYRLRGLRLDHPNQVWSADITYLRLSQGFVYLVALLDWFSRYVLSWSLSPTPDAWFCVQALLSTTARYPTLRLRVLLAVTTGLRRGDIEAIRIGDIHFDRNTIATRNRKAGKAMAERPIPEKVMAELCHHVVALPDGQERLFNDRFSPKKWERVRKRLGLPELKFHDLRKTFAPLLAQRGVSTAVTQRLLEHSSPQLTNNVYTDVDPVLRQAISLLPVTEWV